MTSRRSWFVPHLVLFLLALARHAHARDDLPFIQLPPGFGPEGIATGHGRLYVGNLRDGSILTVDPRTGTGRPLVAPAAGRFALGLAIDERTDNLFVAGGPSGHVYVHDAATGASRADYALAGGNVLANGVVITRHAVYVTDSVNAAIYELPLGPGGALPPPGAVRTMALAGLPTVPRAFNANGIVAVAGGKDLVLVHTSLGKLFHVDAATGLTAEIDLGGDTVPNGDGLWLRGHALYVVQNLSNQIAVVALAPDLRRGTIVRTISDPRFDVITSAARLGDGLYLTNARYTTRPTPDTVYSLVRVPLDCTGR
jgi:hypothetical protein